MLSCLQCEGKIPYKESYIYHTEVGDVFCSPGCADEYDKQFRKTRVNEEPDEEEEDEDIEEPTKE